MRLALARLRTSPDGICFRPLQLAYGADLTVRLENRIQALEADGDNATTVDKLLESAEGLRFDLTRIDRSKKITEQLYTSQVMQKTIDMAAAIKNVHAESTAAFLRRKEPELKSIVAHVAAVRFNYVQGAKMVFEANFTRVVEMVIAYLEEQKLCKQEELNILSVSTADDVDAKKRHCHEHGQRYTRPNGGHEEVHELSLGIADQRG